MGNSQPRRRLLGGYEIDVWESKLQWVNKSARIMRYAKRAVSRRERREGRREVNQRAWEE